MKYKKPNPKAEWPEALRYRIFEKMGYNAWVKMVERGKPVSFSKIEHMTGNVDLDYENLEEEKKKRFEHAFKIGEVELPIVAKFKENRFDLIGGNTRLAGLIHKGIEPKVWVIDIIDGDSEMTLSEEDSLKGGKSDNKTLVDIAKKHDTKGYYHVDDMVKSLEKQVKMGLPIELDHTSDKKIAMEIVKDHLWEDPNYYSKLKKADIDEKKNPHDPDDDKDDVFPTGSSDWRKKKEVGEMDSSSAGAYEAPFGGQAAVIKRPISKIPNFMNEAADSSISAGAAFDVPFGGGGTKGRRDPLKIDGPKSIYKNRAVKDKKWPKFGGPEGVYVKIKEKCKKFPYCNQGDQGNLEFLHEDQEFKDAISKAAEMYGIPYSDVEKIVINEIKKIFI